MDSIMVNMEKIAIGFKEGCLYRILAATLVITLWASLNANGTCYNGVCGEASKCVVRGVLNDSCSGCTAGYTGSKCNFYCPVNCFNCSQRYYEDDNKCDACKEGYYNGKHFDIQTFPTRHDCSLSCQDGCASCTDYKHCIKCKLTYYMTTDYMCMKCPKNCESCTSNTKCDNCVSGYFTAGKYCEPCTSNCKSCVAYSTCFLCKTGFYLKGHVCDICPSRCISCSDDRNCSNCETGYFLSKGFCKTCDDTCLDCHASEMFDYICRLCKEGYYPLNSSCLKCGDFCLQCLSNGTCVTCEKGFGLVNGQCYNCDPLCDSCFTFENCTVCTDEYINIDGKCKICPDNCLHCNLPVPCDACVDGFYGRNCSFPCSDNCKICDKDNGKCIVCETGNYLDKVGKCLKCPKHCVECLSEHSCTLCEKGFKGHTCHCSLNCVCNEEHVCVSCENGYTGEDCRQHCSEGCKEKICSKNTGECFNGCLPGYTGRNCAKDQSPRKEDPADQPSTHSAVVMIGLMLASGVVFFGIVIACALGCFLYKRNRSRNEQRELLELVNSTLQRSKGRPFEAKNDLVEIDDNNETSISNTATETRHSNTPLIQNRKMPLREFEEYVKNKTDAEVNNEFQELPNPIAKSYKESQKKNNQRKNRFRGIYPFDDSRVVLKTGDSSYINASFIDGYNRERVYIASIGPTIQYMGDMSVFWRMVWQENCVTIVMLSNLEEPKPNTCDQYWPDKDYFLTYGEFTVSALTEDIFSDYTVRRFEIQLNSETRVVTQFHYTSWLEADVPADVLSLVTFLREVNRTASDVGAPTVVHCNSGVGRTGTYIALDILTKEGETECHVDVFNCVKNLREQRVRMVQTAEQYKFLHLALVLSLNYYAQISSDSSTQSEDATNLQHGDEIILNVTTIIVHPTKQGGYQATCVKQPPFVTPLEGCFIQNPK